jgi:hypothetical protein
MLVGGVAVFFGVVTALRAVFFSVAMFSCSLSCFPGSEYLPVVYCHQDFTFVLDAVLIHARDAARDMQRRSDKS